MAKGFKTVKERRSIFGWFFLILFIIFNLIMVSWLWVSIEAISTVVQDASTGAGKAGASVGAGIGITFILVIWAIGDVILGIPVMFTRPAKTMVPID